MDRRTLSMLVVLAGALVFLIPFIAKLLPLNLPPLVASFYSLFMTAPLSIPFVTEYWSSITPLILFFVIIDLAGCLFAPPPVQSPTGSPPGRGHAPQSFEGSEESRGDKEGRLPLSSRGHDGYVVVPRFVVSGRLNRKHLEHLRNMIKELRDSTSSAGEEEVTTRMARLSVEPSPLRGEEREEGIEKYFVGELEEYQPGSYLVEGEEGERDEWSERDVDPYIIKISKKHGVPVQNILELLRYISMARRRGLDARKIMESLVEAGWPEDLVEEVMVYSQ